MTEEKFRTVGYEYRMERVFLDFFWKRTKPKYATVLVDYAQLQTASSLSFSAKVTKDEREIASDTTSRDEREVASDTTSRDEREVASDTTPGGGRGERGRGWANCLCLGRYR